MASSSMRVRPAGAFGVYIVLGAGALLTLAPFALSLMTALKTREQAATEGPLTLPHPFTFDNFIELFTGSHSFLTPLVVTFEMTAFILVGQMVFSVMAAYAFGRLTFPGRDAVFWIYLGTMLIPQVATVVPLYVMMSSVGLRNTFWGLVLPTLFGSPYAIFLLREHFRGIPDDVEDAARLDGAGTLRILWSIIVPMSRPILTTLVIITVVSQWNNFMWPLFVTSGPTWEVLTVATQNLQTQYTDNWTLVMAATTLSMAPLVALYLLTQRNIVNSISLTGFK